MIMKTKLLLTGIVLTFVVLFSCEKKEDAPATTTTTSTTGATTGATTGSTTGFTPPTSGYYKINDSLCTPSADAVNVNLAGNTCSVNKKFDKVGLDYTGLNLDFGTTANIMSEVAEGTYKVYDVDTVTQTGKVKVEIYTTSNSAFSGSGTYFFKAKTGKVYVSKKNNELRYTSDGNLNFIGYKYLENKYIYNLTSKFSLKNLEVY